MITGLLLFQGPLGISFLVNSHTHTCSNNYIPLQQQTSVLCSFSGDVAKHISSCVNHGIHILGLETAKAKTDEKAGGGRGGGGDIVWYIYVRAAAQTNPEISELKRREFADSSCPVHHKYETDWTTQILVASVVNTEGLKEGGPPACLWLGDFNAGHHF